MTTYDEAIKKSKTLHDYVADMIRMSDIEYIAHYHFKNLEEIIFCEVKDRLDAHPTEWGRTKEQCEFAIRDICKHIFAEREKEKTDFFLYHFPEYVADLYIKTNKTCTE